MLGGTHGKFLHVDLTHRAWRVETPPDELYRMRQRKGITRREAEAMARNHTVFGSLMLQRGEADALIAGLTQHYPDTIRPALHDFYDSLSDSQKARFNTMGKQLFAQNPQNKQ